MSDENYRDSGNQGGLLLIAALAGLLLGGWQLASALAADRDAIVTAVGRSLPLAGLAWFLWWYFSPSKISILALFLAAAWPCWWPVLDSLAATYADPNSGFLRLSMQIDDAWYGKAWARWSLEAAPLVLLLSGWRRRRD
jgi:hypothetical protein